MDAKNNGKLLLFVLMELTLISSGWKVPKSSVNTVVSISWSQQTLYKAVFTLDFFQKGIWGGKVE